MTKLTFVGLGHTGTAMATAAIANAGNLDIDEIHIFNRDSGTRKVSKTQAVIGDLTDYADPSRIKIISHSSYSDLPNSGIHIITAKESSYDYTKVNQDFMREMTVRRDAPLMYSIGKGYGQIPHFQGDVFIVSNPVGPFAGIFAEHSGIDPERVQQFGTVLDTIRYKKLLNIAIKIQENPELRKLVDQDSSWITSALGLSQTYPDHTIEAIIAGDHSKDGNVFLDSSTLIDGTALSSYDQQLIEKAKKETLSHGPDIAFTLGYTAGGAAKALMDMLYFKQTENTERALPWGTILNGAHITMPMRKKDGQFVLASDKMSKEEYVKLEQVAASVMARYVADSKYATGKQFRRVLVFDDEKDVADGNRDLLGLCMEEDSEYNAKNTTDIDVAYTPDQVMELVKKQLYDVVVFDVKIGNGRYGYQVIGDAMALQPGMKAVALSAHTELAQAKEMIGQEGVVLYMEKPLLDDMDPNYATQANWTLLREKAFDPTQQVIR